MQLSHEQKQHFYEHGYVQIPNAVPRPLVNAALRAINHSIGQGLKAEDIGTMSAQSYCRELTQTPVITDLFNESPVFSLVESALGEGNASRMGGGQIALRFPGLKDPPFQLRPHLDGMHSPNNGVPKGTIGNFTMLVGVLLADVSEDFAGNLAVWPGTHHQYEQWFREHGPDSLLNGMPPIEMPEPVQIKGKAGDAVLCHYELAHCAAPNASANVRYSIYFRVKHPAHNAHNRETMSDIWLDWPGMRELAGR